MDLKQRAVGLDIADGHLAVVRGDDCLDDREPEPGTAAVAGPAAVGAEEPVEDSFALGGWDAWAGIGDGEHRFAGDLLGGHGHGGAGRGVPVCVGQ